MTWEDENKQALAAYVDGDEDTAVVHWRKSVALVDELKIPATFDIGQLYYYLGKSLCDRAELGDGIHYLSLAVNTLTAISPNHEQLTKAKYDLAVVYRRTHQEDKATSLFQDALHLDDNFEWITLQQAIKNLHKAKLAPELSGQLLDGLCNSFGIPIDGNNRDLHKLLVAYYSADATRFKKDKFFHAAYDIAAEMTEHGEQALHSKIAALSELTGIAIETVTIDTADGMDPFYLELNMDGEEGTIKQITSIDDVVDAFNEMLEVQESKKRWCKLHTDDDETSSFFLLDEKTWNRLEQSNTLRFIDLYGFD